jgi:hypothetical protein
MRPDPVIGAFSLENGAAQLRERFASVDTRVYTDALRITDPDAIVDCFCSLNEIREGERVLADDEAELFRVFVAARMAQDGGALIATTRSGMFACRSSSRGPRPPSVQVQPPDGRMVGLVRPSASRGR